MSDQENCQGQEAQQQAQPELVIPTITPEQLEKMQQVQQAKQGMLNTLGQLYGQFIQQIRMYPFTPLQQQQAFIRLDEGHFWMQQSIMQAQVELAEAKAPESEPANPESKADGDVIPEA